MLFVLLFILQYNNYLFTKKALAYHRYINQTQIAPEKIQALHYLFVNKEVFDNHFYTSGASLASDSIIKMLNTYKKDLDSISKTKYVSINSGTQKMISSLQRECDNLISEYNFIIKEILDRGLYTSGESGEWTRFSVYLQDLAGSFNNAALIKNIADINKILNDYQSEKTSEKIRRLLEKINALKVQLSVKTGPGAIAINEASKLKFTKELDTFVALTLDIQKADAKIGFLNGDGYLGDIDLHLGMLQDKSTDVYQNLEESIEFKFLYGFLLKVLLIVVFATIFFIFLKKYSALLNNSINQIKDFTSELMLGKLPHPLRLTSSTEFGDISINLNNFVNSLREKIKFASKLESGQSDTTLVPLSEEDNLANALLDMEKSLQKAAEEDKKYKIDEQKRAWTNEGIALFGEILRMQTDNLATLSDEIIKTIVKYLNANQGGIFIYNDEDKFDIHLELISAFAFDRKKYHKKRIEIGEGLIGTCAQEKQTIFITDIPADYIEITSGLGDAPPRSLLIVPLLIEKSIFGILEIASFSIFQPHEIEFIEKLAQSVASTFSSVKISINTTRLLEQSKKQAEEMAQQEEEMRQNLEELQATQEESARREAEINSLINAVDASSLVIQTDMDGRIIEVNKKFSMVVKINRDDLIGRYLKSVFIFDSQTDEFYNLLVELKKGQIATRSEKTHPDNYQAFLQVHYSPILDHDGKPYKVLGIATNVTEHKLLEQSITQKDGTLSELEFFFNQYKDFVKEGFILCELSPDGTITDVNENYSEITGYHSEELISKNCRKFLKPDELKQFDIINTEVLKDKTYKGVIKRTKPTGEEIWLMTSFVPFKDKSGVIEKIYLLAQDVTEKKLKYQVLEDANKEIERLRGVQKDNDNIAAGN
jgi:PAS domain S-box-containing protein